MYSTLNKKMSTAAAPVFSIDFLLPRSDTLSGVSQINDSGKLAAVQHTVVTSQGKKRRRSVKSKSRTGEQV